MAKIYKAVEWQSTGSERWHCTDPDLIGRGDQWLIPARILNMPIVDFLVYVKDNFNADLHIREDGGFAYWDWTKQSDMRKYKNFINAKSRESKLLF